jgi:hypothetical protein
MKGFWSCPVTAEMMQGAISAPDRGSRLASRLKKLLSENMTSLLQITTHRASSSEAK